MKSNGVRLMFRKELRSVKKKRRRKDECFQVIMRVIDASFDYLVLRKETLHNFLWEGNKLLPRSLLVPISQHGPGQFLKYGGGT